MQFPFGQQLYPRPLHQVEHGGGHFIVDPSRPNWVATNEAGAFLFDGLGSSTSVEELVQAYQTQFGVIESSTARDQVTEFLDGAIGAGVVALEPVEDEPYEGRTSVLVPTRLEEFWVQINDFCNLSCAHCLVSSSPAAGRGLPDSIVRDGIQQAIDLGTELFGITGGEPFFREDIFDLFALILADPGRTVTTLTNGTRLKGETLARLKDIANDRLELRISLDGPTPEVNDPIRGRGSFNGALRGIKNAVETDCHVTITMAVNGANAAYADQMPKLAKELGVKRLHVLWPFQRGRAIEEGQDEDLTPPVRDLIEGYRRIRRAAEEEGVQFFTFDSWKNRIDGAPGLKYDLSNHCWSSLCLYTDGNVYPSPALTQHPELALGNIQTTSLRDLWLNSDVSQRFRRATVIDRPQCRDCHYRFMCGGGDMDHIYNTSRMTHGEQGDLYADDPYCALYMEILGDAMLSWASAMPEQAPANGHPPRLIRRMGHHPRKDPKQLTHGEATLATVPST